MMNTELSLRDPASRMGWLRMVEQIAFGCFGNHRIVGVTAPHFSAGVSTLSRALANISAQWGKETLLIDLSEPLSRLEWILDAADPRDLIQRSEGNYDTLKITANETDAEIFTAPEYLLENLVGTLNEYRSIVLDLPPVLEYSSSTISPILAATKCDIVAIVSVKGQTTFDDLKNVIDMCRVAGVRIGGTVLNEFNPARPRGADKQAA